jgi:hypothetical protein
MKQSKSALATPPTADEQLYNLDKQKFLSKELQRKRNSIEPTSQPTLPKPSREFAQSQRSSPKQRKSSPTSLKQVSILLKQSQVSNGKKQPNQNRKSIKSQQQPSQSTSALPTRGNSPAAAQEQTKTEK